MNVVGTLVVPFGESSSSESGSITAEWDDSLNVDGKGEVKTQFVPGDSIYFLVHHAADVSIVDVKVTAGSIGKVGNVDLARIDELGWGDVDDEQSLNYTPAGNLSFDWKGRKGLGPAILGRAIRLVSGFPCLALVSYKASFIRYRLQAPVMDLEKEETFPLRVYIYYQEKSS